MTQPPNIGELIVAAQKLVDSGLTGAALGLINSNKLRLKIINGKIVDEDDQCEEWLRQFVTVHPVMVELKNDIRKLSKVSDEVLIIGPTGTGKELLARALHGSRTGKFRAINCAGLPEHLIESELFGHERGSFTGATSKKEGLMKLASSSEFTGAGTFFLDEIGELPMSAQGKLLRAIQEKRIRKVGGDEEEPIDCRIVCATNKDISSMVSNGTFRIDLYARIGVFELHTLGLKDREEDIIHIINSLPDGGLLLGRPFTVDMLPFNVRSIQALVKRMKVLGKI